MTVIYLMVSNTVGLCKHFAFLPCEGFKKETDSHQFSECFVQFHLLDFYSI